MKGFTGFLNLLREIFSDNLKIMRLYLCTRSDSHDGDPLWKDMTAFPGAILAPLWYNFFGWKRFSTGVRNLIIIFASECPHRSRKLIKKLLRKGLRIKCPKCAFNIFVPQEELQECGFYEKFSEGTKDYEHHLRRGKAQ